MIDVNILGVAGAALFVGAIVAWFFGSRNKVARGEYEALLQAKQQAEEDRERAVASVQALLEEKARIEADRDAFQRAKKEADENIEALKAEAKKERERYDAKISEVNASLNIALQEKTRLETENKNLDQKIRQAGQDMEKMEEKFRLQFENLANRIFDEKTTKFKKESEEGIAQILSPLKERLLEFQKKVEDSFGDQAKEQTSLKREIERIVLANEKITLQTENLTNALKGDSKMQGNWGEIILENILEESGLRKEQDYVVQYAVESVEGSRQHPDVIIKLPENKHVIIDSKVSLTHYERYFSDQDETSRGRHLKQYLSSVKTHVDDLHKRRYQDAKGMGAPDFVLMFMPMEGAHSLAIQQDRELHNYAWNKKIVIVCPTTLFATLRTIASVWRIELQNRNALEIADRGGKLYDKVVRFVEEMQELGRKIDGTQKSYDEAFKILSTGRGNILKQTQDLKDLGAKASKSLPEELFDGPELRIAND